MDSHKAKEILATYRPGIDDLGDPLVAGALEHVRRDPELRRWFQQQQAVDAVLREKFKGIAVSLSLRDTILASEKILRPSFRWQRPGLLAAAAVIIGLLGVGQLWLVRQKPANFVAYRQNMVDFVSAGYKRDVESEDFEQLRQTFAKNGWPSDYAVPTGLLRIKVEGGVLHQWRGQKVSLICMESGNNRDVWLFVVGRQSVSGFPATNARQSFPIGKLATAAWSDEHNTYLLAGEVDEATLKTFL